MGTAGRGPGKASTTGAGDRSTPGQASCLDTRPSTCPAPQQAGRLVHGPARAPRLWPCKNMVAGRRSGTACRRGSAWPGKATCTGHRAGTGHRHGDRSEVKNLNAKRQACIRLLLPARPRRLLSLSSRRPFPAAVTCQPKGKPVTCGPRGRLDPRPRPCHVQSAAAASAAAASSLMPAPCSGPAGSCALYGARGQHHSLARRLPSSLAPLLSSLLCSAPAGPNVSNVFTLRGLAAGSPGVPAPNHMVLGPSCGCEFREVGVVGVEMKAGFGGTPSWGGITWF